MMQERALETLLTDGFTSTNKPLILHLVNVWFFMCTILWYSSYMWTLRSAIYSVRMLLKQTNAGLVVLTILEFFKITLAPQILS